MFFPIYSLAPRNPWWRLTAVLCFRAPKTAKTADGGNLGRWNSVRKNRCYASALALRGVPLRSSCPLFFDTVDTHALGQDIGGLLSLLPDRVLILRSKSNARLSVRL